MTEEEQLKEINEKISEGIEQWADIMIEAEANEWAYLLNYSTKDLMNASCIFQHIVSNIGIKSGRIDETNADEFGNRLRQIVIDMTGYDPYALAEQMEIHTDLINPSTIIEA